MLTNRSNQQWYTMTICHTGQHW